MIPLPLIARAIVGGGLLGLLIYELAKQGKAEAKTDTSTAETTASDIVETIKEEVEEIKEAAVEMAENVKDKVEEIKESLTTATTPTASADLNSTHLKHFKKEATKRAVKTHTTKAVNKLLEEAAAGTYQIVSTGDADLIAGLVKDYTKKYKAELADGKFRIESSSEKKKHFLSVIF